MEAPKPKRVYKKAAPYRTASQRQSGAVSKGRPLGNNPDVHRKRREPEPPSVGYHGTSAVLQPGDHIIPVSEGAHSQFEYPSEGEFAHFKDNAFFARDVEVATDYAHDGRGGRGRLYRVEPIGQVQRDTNLDLDMDAWMAPRLRVISEVQFDPKTGFFEGDSRRRTSD